MLRCTDFLSIIFRFSWNQRGDRKLRRNLLVKTSEILFVDYFYLDEVHVPFFCPRNELSLFEISDPTSCISPSYYIQVI